MINKNIKTSQNVQRVKYSGAYSICVTDEADLTNLPNSVVVNGRLLLVSCGRVRQISGAVSFYSSGQKFKFPFDCLRYIHDSSHNPIWVNYKLLQE